MPNTTAACPGRKVSGWRAQRGRRGSDLWTLQTMHTEYHPAANQTTRFLRYDKWQDGTRRTTELQTFRLQYWSSREFEGLLAEAGFIGTRVTADYQDTSSRQQRLDLSGHRSARVRSLLAFAHDRLASAWEPGPPPRVGVRRCPQRTGPPAGGPGCPSARSARSCD